MRIFHSFHLNALRSKHLAILLALTAFDLPSRAQTTEPLSDIAESTQTAVPLLSEARVQELLQAAQQATGADDDAHQKQVSLYKQALEQVKLSEQWTSRSLEAEAARIQAPALASRLKEELAGTSPDPVPQLPEGEASLQQLEQLLSGPQQELAEAQKLASDLSTELKRRADRRVEIPQLISAAKQRLEELKVEEAAGPLPDEPAEVTAARLLLVQARRQALEREIETYERELQSYEARSELLTLRQDDASRRVARLEKLVKAWQAIVNERRRGDAEKAALEARKKQRAADQAHPIIRQFTEDNAALAEQRTGSQGLGARIEKASTELEETNTALDQLREQAKGLRSKVDAVGLSDAIGVLLRKQREEAQTLLDRTRPAGSRKAQISEAHLRLLQLEDELAAVRDSDKVVQSTVADILASSPTAGLDSGEVERLVRELLQTKREYLQALIKDYNTYFGTLVELDTVEKQLRTEASTHAHYIEERILWMPTAGVLTFRESDKVRLSAAWLFSPENWGSIWNTLRADTRSSPWIYGMGVLLPAALLLSRRRLWNALEENSRQAGRSGSLSFYSVIRAGAATVLLAFAVPFLLWFTGWRLSVAGADSHFVRTFSQGTMAAAIALLLLEAVRLAAASRGLAIHCFHWAPRALKLLRRNLVWLAAIALPLRVLIEPAQWHGTEIREETLARLLFLVGMVPCAIFAHRILHPSRGVLTGTIAKDSTGWIHRFRYIWYLAGVGIPLLFATATVIGYHYTALHLGARLLTTIWLCLSLIALNAILVHWLVVNRRRLALQEARRRWQAERDNESSEMPESEEPTVDVSAVSVQANRFLRSSMAFAFVAGLWIIWVDVLPALGILRGYELWSRQVKVTETIAGADGLKTLQIVEKVAPVTLADLLFAVVVVLMTIVAARNLPGILEIAVLQRLKMDHGAKYASSTIARYLIILAGGILALRALGVGWQNVQWMAAAVTVGLGFGLQEIFANFVSGLILLFERPIRAGDVVMVNGILGKVGRIQIRATTIVDMDHKELIIPNREFITGQVINYTLSDTVIRLTVTVSVARGSDYDQAQAILLRLAEEHPIILDDPAPIAALSEFKESSVEFILFVHLPDLNNFLSVRHDLIAGIEREFRQAGISIPFPQRDLHVRGIEEALPVSVTNGVSPKVHLLDKHS